MLYFTNRQQFSMDCILIDHRNVIKMFKTQAEPRAAGEWFHCKVWNILTSFLRSITEEIFWKIVVDLLFTITLTILTSISVAREREKKKQTKNKLCHHQVISVVCTLIEHSSRQISSREIAQLW